MLWWHLGKGGKVASRRRICDFRIPWRSLNIGLHDACLGWASPWLVYVPKRVLLMLGDGEN
ncbi:hypothetical protein RchiOBHm_Chr6g0274071 [Rosa chinensis]|uniref:Uncharacterized protein n=1 Tax=Rosa chinensis TaxID=74649 RepID=A0A2P6PRN2_ROSCH|nr:hypothetical protein RchiOBHm_Chr6g0274071 [Rosa chinensis]